jgi:hypothetical protein
MSASPFSFASTSFGNSISEKKSSNSNHATFRFGETKNPTLSSTLASSSSSYKIINCDNDDAHTLYVSACFKSNPVRLYKRGQIIEIKSNSQIINGDFTFVYLADESGFMILNNVNTNTAYLELITTSESQTTTNASEKTIIRYTVIKVDGDNNLIVRSEPTLKGHVVKRLHLGICPSIYLSIHLSINLSIFIYFR